MKQSVSRGKSTVTTFEKRMTEGERKSERKSVRDREREKEIYDCGLKYI